MNNITYAVSVDVNNPIIPYNVYVASVLDSNVRYLEITLYQNGNVIVLSNTATATASLVTDGVLIDDSVNCTISNNIITVPLEDLQRHGNLDVQVTVTEGTKVLAIPFPIQVIVTPNIAENAQIDENSLGSYADVVREIAAARGDYPNLKDRLDGEIDRIDDGISDINTALLGKANKAAAGSAGELAALDGNGSPIRSGVSVIQSIGEGSNRRVPTTKAVRNALNDAIAAKLSAAPGAIENLNLEAIPHSVKLAMDTLFSKAAYADADAASSYATFHAWAISNPVTFITAVFTQGSATIRDTGSLNKLKQYLTVTATYSDSTTATVTDYTLSGTLTEGTSTITVSYGGKTTTFNVTVTENSLTVQPNIIYAYGSGKLAASENMSATSIIPIDDTSITHTVSAAVNGVEVDILLKVFDQNGLALNSNGLAKSQTIPAKDYKCFGVVLAHVVTANDVVTVTVDGVQEQASYGTLEEYSNTVPVDIQVGGIDGTTGEIIENSARLITGFIDIVPGGFSESAPEAQLLLTAQSGVYVKAFEYSDSSFLQNSSIGALNSNQARGNPAPACTKFRVLFKKSDDSNFTSADIESLTLNNHDFVTYEFTEVN